MVPNAEERQDPFDAFVADTLCFLGRSLFDIDFGEELVALVCVATGEFRSCYINCWGFLVSTCRHCNECCSLLCRSIRAASVLLVLQKVGFVSVAQSRIALIAQVDDGIMKSAIASMHCEARKVTPSPHKASQVPAVQSVVGVVAPG